MKYFNGFYSNTLAGTGNQSFFQNEEEDLSETGRVFYKITAGGKFEYSFLFSNIIDSTYGDGTFSCCNCICDSWRIQGIGACVAASPRPDGVGKLKRLTFSGKPCKDVAPGEFFATDPAVFEAQAGDYLCLEISFCGKMIPCHPESLIPAFILKDGGWVPASRMPLAGMVGCNRPIRLKVGFLGDSITQGIGTEPNSYAHWNAKLAEKLGLTGEYAYWNLGLGYGRAHDAASDGAWLFKAKQTDIALVCYGVNDLIQIGDENQLKRDLEAIVAKLYEAGTKVILQTLPPFDYEGERIGQWRSVNRYIKESLSSRVEAVFDVVPILGQDGSPHLAKYGGHPNAEGCAAWADALYEVVKPVFEKTAAQL